MSFPPFYPFVYGSMILGVLLLLGGCQSRTFNEDLPGEWQAISLIVQDSVWNVETEPVRLTLGEDGDYQLIWYSGEHETGDWEYKPPHLVITSEPAGKRFMTIIDIQRDSLVLQGLQEARSVRLGFVRIKPRVADDEVQ